MFTDPLFGRGGEQPVMGVYYRRPTGEISLVIEDLNRPNGIMLSPAEETLYVLPSSGSSTLPTTSRPRAWSPIAVCSDRSKVEATA